MELSTTLVYVALKVTVGVSVGREGWYFEYWDWGTRVGRFLPRRGSSWGRIVVCRWGAGPSVTPRDLCVLTRPGSDPGRPRWTQVDLGRPGGRVCVMYPPMWISHYFDISNTIYTSLRAYETTI